MGLLGNPIWGKPQMADAASDGDIPVEIDNFAFPLPNFAEALLGKGPVRVVARLVKICLSSVSGLQRDPVTLAFWSNEGWKTS